MRSTKQKKYFKYIDIMRVFACIAILFYHINILKGGYLAVCIFFVLSGYLSCKSSFQKEKFSILAFYKNRILKVYVPLVLVVFFFIAFLSFQPNIIWLNLKTETTSILLGYNNFWQLYSNLDYFARSVHSPFLHIWYLAILMQLDLIFPLIYIGLQKISKKINKFTACALPVAIALISFLCFYKFSFSENILFSYYHTFLRCFSWLLGISLGFIHKYYKTTIVKNSQNFYKKLFWTYFAILFFLFLLINANSIYYSLSMLVVSIITCRMIELATLITMTKKEAMKKSNKWISFLSKISYFIYLVQYPVIFIFQYSSWTKFIKIPLILIISLILSYVIYFSFTTREQKNIKKRIVKYSVWFILFIGTMYGCFIFATSKNHTIEMKELEKQLQENEKLLEQKQEEVQEHLQKEANEWAKKLENLEQDAENIHDIVSNLPIVGIGDSVMLGAVENLYESFPNGYFDAQVSRSVLKGKEILQDLKTKGLLKGPIVLNLGANGDCSAACKEEILEISKENEIFWLTVTNDNDVHVNDKLFAMEKSNKNVHVIDWNANSKEHGEYFYADGIHLTKEGRIAYTSVIKNTIEQVYTEIYQRKKEEIVKEHEEDQKKKISFYGNNLLLNAYIGLQEKFPKAKFITNQNYTFDLLKKDLEIAIQENSLNYNLVLVLDKMTYLSENNYKKLFALCGNRQIYVLTINEEENQTITHLNKENVHILNFYDEIKKHKEYLRKDGIHLTEEGNNALNLYLQQELNIER